MISNSKISGRLQAKREQCDYHLAQCTDILNGAPNFVTSKKNNSFNITQVCAGRREI